MYSANEWRNLINAFGKINDQVIINLSNSLIGPKRQVLSPLTVSFSLFASVLQLAEK
jgi:hypothetical protein